MRVEVREGAEVYGARVGILHVQCRIPFAPGGVGHAQTYPYPVVFRTIEGGLDTPTVEANVVAAARWLERQGVAAITSDCGTLIRHQRAVADAVAVPVLLSPLLQLPFVLASVGPSLRVGVVAAVAANVDEEQLALGGVDGERIVVAGMEEQPAFRAAVLDESGVLDTDAVQREAVAVAVALVAEHPDIGALVFDCADLPPYAGAVRTATGCPVFDFVTMIHYAELATRGTA